MDILFEVLSTVFMFGIFAILYFFLNLVSKEPIISRNKVLGWSMVGLVAVAFMGIFLTGLLFHLFGMLANTEGFTMEDFAPFSSLETVPALLHQLGFSLWIPALLALLFLIPAVRKGLARFIPIDPASTVHTVSLMLSTSILIQMAVTYAIGLDVLSSMEVEADKWGTIAGIWAQDLMFVLISFLGVGYLTRRSAKESLKRLGLVKPTLRQLIIGLLMALGLVFVVFTLEILMSQLGWGANPDVEEYTEKLIGPLFTSIPGILTLGFAAAIGEETLFRGAMQPRFGILLTSVLFALVHSNYGLTLSTLIVFGVGLCLGWVRIRYNTTTAMVVHATYNICLGILSYLQI